MENGTHLTMVVYPALIRAHLSGLAQRLSVKALTGCCDVAGTEAITFRSPAFDNAYLFSGKYFCFRYSLINITLSPLKNSAGLTQNTLGA